jgi:hypothetical protein
MKLALEFNYNQRGIVRIVFIEWKEERKFIVINYYNPLLQAS